MFSEMQKAVFTGQALLFCGLLFIGLFPSAAMAQTPGSKLIEIQNSHIEHNIPEERDFTAMLDRELVKYFRRSEKTVERVDCKLLRSWSSPTQSGVSYPKYYAWVRAYANNDRFVCAGAVRIAAMEKIHLEITHYLDSKEICKNPDDVAKIFPAPLCEGILNRARATDLDL